MRILILAAFRDELTSITRHFLNLKETMISKCRCLVTQWSGHDLVMSLAGIGTSASAITTTILCETLNPDLIIFCGVAGGLKPFQQIGDLILASKIIDADLHQLPAILRDSPYKNALIDPHTLTSITTEYTIHRSILDIMSSFSFERLKTGIIVTSNTFPAPKSLFSEIKNLDCSAIEMESAGVFKAAEYYDVPVITLRAISNLLDDAGHDLGTSPDALEICAERLALCLTALLNHTQSLNMIADFNQQKKMSHLIAKYELTQHPEGGWYRQTFRSNDWVKAAGNASTRYLGEPRTAGTSILYLLAQGDFSGWHTVQSDETWYAHAGDALLLRIIDPMSGELNEMTLGTKEGCLQFTVRAGHLFSAEPLGRFCLAGCAVTPGFDFKDFKLLTREAFVTTYPQHIELARLARDTSVIPIR
ncbi:MAG: cupin domain-containing protein [Gammaproteobacteria bacterium]|nr:cupin domain-containing protein [Gammaproteobacteria bacterium]